MSSRRFTAQCLRASTEKDSTTGGSAAVRDFNPAYDRFGSNATDRHARDARPMSASPPIEVKHWHRSETPLRAKTGCEQSQQTAALFDHLVGAGEQCRRNLEADRFGTFANRAMVSRNCSGSLRLRAPQCWSKLLHQFQQMQTFLLEDLPEPGDHSLYWSIFRALKQGP